MQKKKTKLVALTGIIAALYVLAVLLGAPLASGAVQLRFAEALTVLPAFTAAGLPGVTLGCFLSALLTGAPLPDMIFGTLATLLGAVGTRLLRTRRLPALLCPIVSNSLILPFVLRWGYGISGSLGYFFVTVALGEILSVGLLGSLLWNLLERRKGDILGKAQE